jgi:hypothetical protein
MQPGIADSRVREKKTGLLTAALNSPSTVSSESHAIADTAMTP